jgi:hypothetical protein
LYLVGGQHRKGAERRVRQSALGEGKLGGDYCSPCEREEGELENEGDATAVELGNGGGSGGAPV